MPVPLILIRGHFPPIDNGPWRVESSAKRPAKNAIAEHYGIAGHFCFPREGPDFFGEGRRNDVICIKGKDPISLDLREPELTLTRKRIEPALNHANIRIAARQLNRLVSAVAVDDEYFLDPRNGI